MSDLELAKQEFIAKQLSLVIVNQGAILHKQSATRLLPLLKALSAIQGAAQGCCVADKVIGRAAAMLLITFGVKAIYTPIMSDGARLLLTQANIELDVDQFVPHILDPSGENLCFMEQMVQTITDPVVGSEALITFFVEKGLFVSASNAI